MPKNIKTISIELKNFKGITGKWELGEKRNLFYGRNGAGKTTLFDAHEFVTKGKDSFGRQPSDFGIKTLKKGKNNPKERHSATEVFDVDGKQISFGRTYYERWSKKRGSAEATKDGNKTDYYVNGDKVSPSVFTSTFADTLGPDYFLCSDGRHLPALSWKDRRKILIDMVGIDESKFIDQVDGLRELLGNRDVEAAKAYYDDLRKEINGNLSDINPKIKEYQNKEQSETGGITLEMAEEAVKIQRGKVESAQKAIDDFKAGLKPAIDPEKLQALNAQLESEKLEFMHLRDRAREKENARQAEIEVFNSRLASRKRTLSELLSTRDSMRKARREKKESSPADIPESCHYCGTLIEEPQIEYITENFNLEKSKWLEADKEKGLALKDEIEKTEQQIKSIRMELDKLESEKPDPIINASTNDSIKTLEIEIDRLSKMQYAGQKETPSELLDALKQAEHAKDQAVETKARIDANAKDVTRLAELIEEKRQLSNQLDRCMSFAQKYGEYADMLAANVEDPVNGLFEKTHFKMFSTLENGSTVPDCVVMDKNLKPYNGVLSNGERVQIEADIVATMQKHLKCRATAWFDNVDGVSDPINLKCQIVELHHDRNFNELTHKKEEK